MGRFNITPCAIVAHKLFNATNEAGTTIHNHLDELYQVQWYTDTYKPYSSRFTWENQSFFSSDFLCTHLLRFKAENTAGIALRKSTHRHYAIRHHDSGMTSKPHNFSSVVHSYDARSYNPDAWLKFIEMSHRTATIVDHSVNHTFTGPTPNYRRGENNYKVKWAGYNLHSWETESSIRFFNYQDSHRQLQLFQIKSAAIISLHQCNSKTPPTPATPCKPISWNAFQKSLKHLRDTIPSKLSRLLPVSGSYSTLYSTYKASQSDFDSWIAHYIPGGTPPQSSLLQTFDLGYHPIWYPADNVIKATAYAARVVSNLSKFDSRSLWRQNTRTILNDIFQTISRDSAHTPKPHHTPTPTPS